MKKQNSFKNLFTKEKMIGLGRFLITSLTIATIMACIESLCVYALETYRFHPNPNMHWDTKLWAEDWGIAICLAWPLSWILTTMIPEFWKKNVFSKAEAKHGKPSKGQIAGGFVMVTLNIVIIEALLMSLMMYSIDTKVLVPNRMGQVIPDGTDGKTETIAHTKIWDASAWAKDWGSAIGIAFPCALVVTSLVPMGYKKLFAFIDGKKAVKAGVPYQEADLKEKIEYLDDEQDATKAGTKVRKTKSKKETNKVSK